MHAVKRTYDNTSRANQAGQTRAKVVAAAHDLFLASGYAQTSMSSVALAAGVSRETVYKAFGSKKALMKVVYDVTVAGDDRQVPMTDRDSFRAMLTDPDAHRVLETLAELHDDLFDRLGPLVVMIMTGGRAGEPDLADLASVAENERLLGVRMVVEALGARNSLRPGLGVARATDIAWLLVAPEVWNLLVGTRGWTRRDYRDWLAVSLTDSLLG